MYEVKKKEVKSFIDEACKDYGIQSRDFSYYEMFKKVVSMLQPSIYFELKNHIEKILKNEKLKKNHLEILMKYHPMVI